MKVLIIHLHGDFMVSEVPPQLLSLMQDGSYGWDFFMSLKCLNTLYDALQWFSYKLIQLQHSFYSSARPCGIAHAQIRCHPKTKSKVRPKKKTRDTKSERPFSWETDRNDFHWKTLGWSTKYQAMIVIMWDETSVHKIMEIQSLYSLGFQQRYWQGIPMQSKRHPISGGSMRTKFSCSIWNGLEFSDCGF